MAKHQKPWTGIVLLLITCFTLQQADARIALRYVLQEETPSAAPFRAETRIVRDQNPLPLGNYTIKNTAADVARTLEDPDRENAKRFMVINPAASIIVLRDLNVPPNTVNIFDCNQAALDLRNSGLDATHSVRIYNGVVILPSELSHPTSAPYEWTIQNSNILTSCEEESPIARFKNSTLAELSSASDRVHILLINSSVRCLTKDQLEKYVQLMDGLQGSLESGRGGDDTSSDLSTSATTVIVVAAGCLFLVVAALNVYLCCFRTTNCTRPVKILYSETNDQHMFPPPPSSDLQHDRVTSVRNSASCDFSKGISEWGNTYTGPMEKLKLTSHSMNSTSERLSHEVAAHKAASRYTSGPSSGGRPARLEVDLWNRSRTYSEDTCRSSESSCASTPKFIGSRTLPSAPCGMGSTSSAQWMNSSVDIKLMSTGASDDLLGFHAERKSKYGAPSSSGTISVLPSAQKSLKPRWATTGRSSVKQYDSATLLQKFKDSTKRPHPVLTTATTPSEVQKPAVRVSRVSQTHTVVSAAVQKGQAAVLRSSVMSRAPKQSAPHATADSWPQEAMVRSTRSRSRSRRIDDSQHSQLLQPQSPVAIHESSAPPSPQQTGSAPLRRSSHLRRSVHAVSVTQSDTNTSTSSSQMPAGPTSWPRQAPEDPRLQGGTVYKPKERGFDTEMAAFNVHKGLEAREADCGPFDFAMGEARQSGFNAEPLEMLSTMAQNMFGSFDEDLPFPVMPSFDTVGERHGGTDQLMDGLHRSNMSASSSSHALWYTCKPGADDDTSSAVSSGDEGSLPGVSAADSISFRRTETSSSYFSDGNSGWTQSDHETISKSKSKRSKHGLHVQKK